MESKKRLYWLLPLFSAIAVRSIFLVYLFNSPFINYNFISGLDMKTIYRMRLDSVYLSLYYLFLKFLNLFIPQQILPNCIIIFNCIMGVFLTLFILYLAKIVTERGDVALFSGLIYAFYSPVIVYEGFILKTIFFTFFMFSALVFFAYLHKQNFKNLYCLFIGGILLTIPFLIRKIGLIWSLLLFSWFIFFIYMERKEYLIKGIALRIIMVILGFLSGLLLIYEVNHGYIPNFSLSSSSINYYYKVGLQPGLDSINIKSHYQRKRVNIANSGNNFNKTRYSFFEGSSKNNIIKLYLKKIGILFSSYEVPNNINYYFIREYIPLLKFTIGPLLLFPFAIAGLLLLFFYLFKSKKPYIILMVLYVIPITIGTMLFLPLARYKLVLAPLLAIGGGFFVADAILFCRELKIKRLFIMGGLPLFLFLIDYFLGIKNFYRSTDYIVYGQAVRMDNPNDMRILKSFLIAYKIRPDKENSIKNLVYELLIRGYYREAVSILKKVYNKPRFKGDFFIDISYASALIGIHDYNTAYKVLSSIRKPKGKWQQKELYFNFAEYYFLTEKYKMSLSYYKKSLCYLSSKDRILKAYILKKIAIIENILKMNK